MARSPQHLRLFQGKSRTLPTLGTFLREPKYCAGSVSPLSPCLRCALLAHTRPLMSQRPKSPTLKPVHAQHKLLYIKRHIPKVPSSREKDTPALRTPRLSRERILRAAARFLDLLQDGHVKNGHQKRVQTRGSLARR